MLSLETLWSWCEASLSETGKRHLVHVKGFMQWLALWGCAIVNCGGQKELESKQLQSVNTQCINTRIYTNFTLHSLRNIALHAGMCFVQLITRSVPTNRDSTGYESIWCHNRNSALTSCKSFYSRRCRWDRLLALYHQEQWRQCLWDYPHRQSYQKPTAHYDVSCLQPPPEHPHPPVHTSGCFGVWHNWLDLLHTCIIHHRGHTFGSYGVSP